VTLSDEAANDRFSRRCEPLGISVAELMSRARVPNAGRPDRPDPDEPDNPSKFHRFEKLAGTRVQGRRFKLVCVTEEAADADLPGRIHIVTMVDLG